MIMQAIYLAAIVSFAAIVVGVFLPDRRPKPKTMDERIDENIRREMFAEDIRTRWGDCSCGFLYSRETGRCERCGMRHG